MNSIDLNGRSAVITGGASVGQGFETVMAQVCAQTLGCDYRNVRVVHGRTDRIEFGIGAHASRATVMTANAVAAAAANVRAKALDMAAVLLQADKSELDIRDGVVRRRGAATGPSISLAKVAQALRPTAKTRGARAPGLFADGWFETDHQVYPYGNQFCVAKLDPDTGAVTIEKYLVAYDIGRAINPTLVRGQIMGGFAQGLGGALYEEFLYDERGEPLSVSLADYLIPTIKEMPPVEILLAEDAPSPRNPLGIKGAGESGIAPVGAAIAAKASAADSCVVTIAVGFACWQSRANSAGSSARLLATRVAAMRVVSGASSLHMAAPSLSASRPSTSAKFASLNSSRTAVASARAPSTLCAPSSRNSRLPICARCSRPAQRVVAKPSRSAASDTGNCP